MQIPLTVIGGTQLAAAFLWATLVVFGNGYLEPTPAFTYGCGLLLLATVALVGIAVSHGRWAWRLTLGVIGMEAIAAVLVEPTAWWWVGLLTSASGLILTLGPWTDPHVRQLPPPAPLPKESMALMLGLLGLPSALALTNEIDVWAGVLAGMGVITAWAYGRALVAGLWAARTLLLPLAVAVAITGGWVRAVVALSGASVLTLLSWSAGAHNAAIPLDPRQVRTSPVFAEFAPREVLDAAGYDEHGRPRS